MFSFPQATEPAKALCENQTPAVLLLASVHALVSSVTCHFYTFSPPSLIYFPFCGWRSRNMASCESPWLVGGKQKHICSLKFSMLSVQGETNETLQRCHYCVDSKQYTLPVRNIRFLEQFVISSAPVKVTVCSGLMKRESV